MTNLRSITDLPIAETTEGLNIIVNDNGNAKQIAASAVGAQADWNVADETSPAYIKNKPHRELMYEWNFDFNDGVSFIDENVEHDITWICDKDNHFEIEFCVYGLKYDDSTGDVFPDKDVVILSKINSNEFSYISYPSLERKDACEVEHYSYSVGNIYFHFENGMHYIPDSYGDYLECPVDCGGNIYMNKDTELPINYVRIYKTTK